MRCAWARPTPPYRRSRCGAPLVCWHCKASEGGGVEVGRRLARFMVVGCVATGQGRLQSSCLEQQTACRGSHHPLCMCSSCVGGGLGRRTAHRHSLPLHQYKPSGHLGHVPCMRRAAAVSIRGCSCHTPRCSPCGCSRPCCCSRPRPRPIPPTPPPRLCHPPPPPPAPGPAAACTCT